MKTATHIRDRRLRPVPMVTERSLQPFIDLYLRNHAAQLTVAKEMAGSIRKYFGPLLATPLTDLTPIQIEDWFHGVGASSPSMANKSLSILRTMFEKARDWRLFSGDNPCVRIKRYKEHSRNRFVQPEEMPRLMEVLHRESEQTQCYFLLCLMVGCRRTEAITIKWQDLDFINGRWHKPHTKTDRAQTVPVPLALLKRIEVLPKYNEYVFPFEGNRPHIAHKGHLATSKIFYAWKRIRAAAGLPDVTVHDLRRTCASWLACHGENLAIIGNVLNHSGLQDAAIYARLNLLPVTRAQEENSVRMLPTAPAAPSLAMRPPQQTSKAEWEEWPG
jgi:integrase